jgi:CMP/dCMP kinase
MIITIDGPMASGKSTAARRLAESLHLFYISSGLLFRGLAYAILQTMQKLQSDKPDISTTELASLIGRLQYVYTPKTGASITLNGNDITAYLKNPEVSTVASLIGTDREVRRALASWQRTMAAEHKNIIVEGRDAGSVVFSNADLKIFLTANVPVRAVRLQHDLRKQGIDVDFEKACRMIQERDERDSNRELAPLIIPAGAVVIDNSELSVEETVTKILEFIHKLIR